MDIIKKQCQGYRFSIDHRSVCSSNTCSERFDEEIVVFTASTGRLIVTIEDTEYDVKSGEALVIPPNLSHSARGFDHTPCEYDTVRFNVLIFEGKGYRLFAQPLLFNSGNYILKLSDVIEWQKEAVSILKKLIGFTAEKDTENWRLSYHGWIFILWSIIYNNHYINIMSVQSFQKLYNRMLAAVNYIHEHYQEEINNEILAEQVHFSIGTFCRYFKKIHGETPINYLNKYRISKSRTLLINTDKKISDIAYLCGYNNLSHFNRDFKTYMSSTPSEYRKNG
jgi:AraC-like DNA-binding protein